MGCRKADERQQPRIRTGGTPMFATLPWNVEVLEERCMPTATTGIATLVRPPETALVAHYVPAPEFVRLNASPSLLADGPAVIAEPAGHSYFIGYAKDAPVDNDDFANGDAVFELSAVKRNAPEKVQAKEVDDVSTQQTPVAAQQQVVPGEVLEFDAAADVEAE
jgi:hypothetical protein